MRRPTGSPRELVMLGLGAALVLTGLLSKPRDAALIACGLGLLTATPAAAPKPKDPASSPDSPGSPGSP